MSSVVVLFLASGVLAALFLFLYFCVIGYDNDGGYMITGTLSVVMILIFIVTAFAFPISYFNSVSQNAELLAFQEHTLNSYKHAIKRTEQINIESENLAGVGDGIIIDLGKLTHQGIANTVGYSIENIAAKVDWYNKTLAIRRAQNNIWFLDSFLQDPPEELKPITLFIP